MASCNIFLIEDNPHGQFLFVEAIKKIDNCIKYTVAYDDQDALNKLKILKHLPDIIFLDMDMRHMDGFEFLAYLKADKLLNQIPVIILSLSNNLAEKVYDLGADGFITKPPALSKLQSEIEAVMNTVKGN